MRIEEGCVAVVTGASGGLGRALSLALARRGCRLVLVDIDPAALAALAAEIPGAAALPADVASPREVDALAERVRETHGAAHLLVNNAGVYASGPLERLAPEDISRLVDVNLKGTIWGCRSFLPLLREQRAAHVVNISSLLGLVGAPGKAAYCASKWAIRGFSEALRAELEGTAVRVTCVFPGAIQTPLVQRAAGLDAEQRAIEDQYLRAVGMPPEDVAQAVLRGVLRGAASLKVGC